MYLMGEQRRHAAPERPRARPVPPPARVSPKVVSERREYARISLTPDTDSHLVPVLHAQAATAMDALLGA